MSLKLKITEDMKSAMRAKDSARLGAIRLLQAAIKQREVDERIELTDDDVMKEDDDMLELLDEEDMGSDSEESDDLELTDDDVIIAIEKMLKQRRDSIAAYESANRTDLADVEKYEVSVLQEYMPQQLTDAEIKIILDRVVFDTDATGVKDMGKVMAAIKPLVAGKADMGKISGLIKTRLA